MADWRVTLNRDLPIEDFDWDAGDARGRVFRWATNAEGEFDAARAADAFLIADPSTGLKGDLHFPVADLRDGRLIISAAALRAARSRFGQGFPEGVPADVRERANELAGTLLDEFNERQDIDDEYRDKLAKREGKWVALSEDGSKELGTYDTEAEARERLRQVEAAKAAKDDGIDIDDVRLDARSEEEKAEIRKRWQEEGPNIGPARMKEWLDSPFAGPNRKTGDAKARARRVANRALRLMEKSTADWTDADYSGALQVLAFIARMREVKPGDPLVIDGREGPTPQRASLLDWGFDPKKDSDLRTDAKERTEVERAIIGVDFETMVNMTPAQMRKWRESPFAGVKRLTGQARTKAMRLGDKARRLADKDIEKWSPGDFDAAAEVLTAIDKVLLTKSGEPLIIDNRTGPSEQTARLKDLGHDPVKVEKVRTDADDRQDARPRWQWMSQGDSIVRPAHKVLHGKTFVLGKRPPEGEPGDPWNCRCYAKVVPSRGTKRELAVIERTAARAKRLAVTRWDGVEEHADGTVMLQVQAGRPVSIGDGSVAEVQAQQMLPIIDAMLAVGQAPAVHTESRVHVEEVYRADRVELTSEHAPIRHPHGWVTYPILYSRIGLQKYPWGLEWRSPEEVFDRKSMDSGVGDPWELRHSADLLTPSTVRGVALGTILTVDEYHDGVHTFGWSKAWAKELLEAVEGRDGIPPEAPQVSVAYRCKVDRRPGTTDDGQRFDGRQYDIVWNSLASEPHGRAGTARVLGQRMDAANAIIVRRADDLLAYGRQQQLPGAPIIYDMSGWVRHDSAADAAPPPENKGKDTPMKILEMMLAKHGKTAAELAEALGVEEADLEAALENEDVMMKAIEFLMMPMDAGMPMREDMMTKVMIGDKEYEVPPEVAAEMARLEERTKMDAGTIKRTQDALAKAEDEAKKRKDAMDDMVSRTDAQAMVAARGLEIAYTIELAKRSLGNSFMPEARKDAEGGDLPLAPIDWKRAALRGAYGDDEAKEICARLDAKPEAIRDALYDDRLLDARAIIDSRAHTSAQQVQSFARNRKTQSRTGRQDGADPLLSATASTQVAATNSRTAANGG